VDLIGHRRSSKVRRARVVAQPPEPEKDEVDDLENLPAFWACAIIQINIRH
jgi:hypothetical protein